MRWNFYLASSFSLKDRIRRVHDQLLKYGHKVPDVWWNEDLKDIDLPDGEWYEHPDVVDISERHWESIEECDVFVLVCPMDESKKFTGANVELGYAHAYGKPCFAIGKLERSAMYVPVTQVWDVETMLQCVEVRLE